MKSILTLLTGLTLLATADEAQAALTLSIDTDTKTYSFSGVDSGTFADFGSFNFMSWNANQLNGGDFGGTQADANGLWTSSVGSPAPGFTGTSFYVQADAQGPAPTGQVTIGLFNSELGPTTVTGTGGSASYSGLSAANMGLFEGLIGTNVPLSNGSGFGSLRVIPEPSHALLLVVGIAGIGLRRRRS